MLTNQASLTKESSSTHAANCISPNKINLQWAVKNKISIVKNKFYNSIPTLDLNFTQNTNK